MADEIVKESLLEAEQRMKGTLTVLEEDLAGIRTGRASPALVDRLLVEYYGTPTPLQQLATISVPEPQLITIRPFDPSTLDAIEKAIRTSELGLTPGNDGKLIRLPLPSLTEERRHELVKVVSKRLEDARVALRNVRRDTRDDLREYEKEKLMSEDEFHTYDEELQKLTDHYGEQVDDLGERKEKEILEI